MQCPSCKAHEHSDIHLVFDGFKEDLIKCPVCSTLWSVNHGVVEIVADAQGDSFLAAATECVECDDYNMYCAAHE